MISDKDIVKNLRKFLLEQIKMGKVFIDAFEINKILYPSKVNDNIIDDKGGET